LAGIMATKDGIVMAKILFFGKRALARACRRVFAVPCRSAFSELDLSIMIILGIETSCDETAVALVEAVPHHPHGAKILAHHLATQLAEHAPYGGVVPEIAARAHLDHLPRLLPQVMASAGLSYDDLTAVAATTGPGLIGGVMVGAMMGKAIAAAAQKPFIAINHLEAHALMVRLETEVQFPFLLLLVSGGHCQFLWVEDVGHYEQLGATLDDAVGECFDKVAKLMGLPYPGGPAIEAIAKAGDPARYLLPRSMQGRAGCMMSFSGLKTAVRQIFEKDGNDANIIPHLAASFQKTVADILSERLAGALTMLQDKGRCPSAFVLAGGVAANQNLRSALAATAATYGLDLLAPTPSLCTDNGVMIAYAGLERYRRHLLDDLAAPCRPRWPLEELAG
jgi:N6-L-threonylcarbamoyladenine synthase